MMRRLGSIGLAAVLLGVAGLPAGCEWSGGSSGSSNTSRGAGTTLNISGFYTGLNGGGKAVDTSRGNVQNFTVNQNGNRLDVIDNQGSRYQGTVGSPDVSTLATRGGTIPASTQVMQFQVNWRGTDGVAAQDIQFVGVIDVVTVTDVVSRESGSSSSSSQSASDSRTTSGSGGREGSSSSSTDTSIEDSSDPGDGVVEDIGDDENIITGAFSFMTGVVVTNINTDFSSEQSQASSAQADRDTSRDVASESERASSSSRVFELTGANVQLRLRGTWVEASGRASTVNALSTGTGGGVVQAAGQ